MTALQAKENQTRIAKHYDLGWWYGTRCEKCCGVYPKFMTTNTMRGECYYQCEVCGKRTEPTDMPWQAEKAWNAGKYVHENKQLSLF